MDWMGGTAVYSKLNAKDTEKLAHQKCEFNEHSARMLCDAI